MNCRSRNVTLLFLVLVVAAGFAAAQSTPPARIPASYPTANNPMVTGATPRIEFEGPNTADFFNSINNPNAPNSNLMANPQIAVGPDEIVMVVNSQIWRLPNGNAAGNLPTGLYPGSVLIGGQGFGAQRASLDNWIGATALAQLCPTGNTDPSGTIDSTNTRSSVTCQINHATVTYDQMQGRFLVLFTVVDTGLTFDQPSQSYKLTRPRKASWVLVVSRFAVLIDQACFQNTELGCPNTSGLPPSAPNAAGSFAFVTPIPPSGSNTGGIATKIWGIYYGDALNGLGATDGFGSVGSSAVGVNTTPATAVGFGNINALPGIAAAATAFDCAPNAVQASGGLPTGAPAVGGVGGGVCYFPTDARIGVDNDTVTIVSPVVDVNINGADLSPIFNPTGAAGQTIPGYAGNRVRVIKKTGLYNFNKLAAGNQFAAATAAVVGDYYDLFTSNSASAATQGTPVVNTPGPAIPYTVIVNDLPCTAGTRPDSGSETTTAAGNVCRMTPVFLEPAHLRGRAQASFSNLNIPTFGAAGAVLQNSQTYLEGVVSSPILQNTMYIYGVQEVYALGGLPGPNSFGPSPFYPVLMTGTTPVGNSTAANGLIEGGLPAKAFVNGYFTNPAPVAQLNFRSSGGVPGQGGASPNLFVGDDRPHNLIFREGYLYDAQVIGTASATQGVFPIPPASLSTTVKYDILQKLCSQTATCPVPLPAVNETGTLTVGSILVTKLSGGGTTVLAPGMAVTGVGIQAGTVIGSVSPDGTTTTINLSLPAVIGGAQTLTFAFPATTGAPSVAYQNLWQNTTSAYAPMFDVPANVVTFGVGSPYNALGFLEKTFNATTNPPLAGFLDGAYAAPPVLPACTLPAIVCSAQAAQLASLTAEFDFFAGAGDPRTRETFGSTGLAPIQLNVAANCFSAQFSPGGPISGAPNNPLTYASLFDTRCGTDVTDSNPQVRDPYVGTTVAQTAYTIRGGEAIDPNDGSLWNFGAYAMKRDASFTALAHWGTFAANYKLSFPAFDVYGNSTTLFNDIAGIPEQNFIQIAVNNGLTPSLAGLGGVPVAPPNSSPIPFAANQVYTGTLATGPIPGTAPAAGNFGPNDQITRREMAYWIVKSIMDESAITTFLINSSALTGVQGYNANAVTFADVPFSDSGYRYIEVMARKGYTSGCSAGVARRYCPDYISTRRDLAAFMIRAKFGNVFPSTLSGCTFGFVPGTTSPTSTIFPPSMTTNCAGGDNFGLFTTGLQYFTDNPQVTGNDWYVFLQKMRELRITNGTFLGPNIDGRNGQYSSGKSIYTCTGTSVPPISCPADPTDTVGNLLRKQVATFMVRGFFL